MARGSRGVGYADHTCSEDALASRQHVCHPLLCSFHFFAMNTAINQQKSGKPWAPAAASGSLQLILEGHWSDPGDLCGWEPLVSRGCQGRSSGIQVTRRVIHVKTALVAGSSPCGPLRTAHPRRKYSAAKPRCHGSDYSTVADGCGTRLCLLENESGRPTDAAFMVAAGVPVFREKSPGGEQIRGYRGEVRGRWHLSPEAGRSSLHFGRCGNSPIWGAVKGQFPETGPFEAHGRAVFRCPAPKKARP